MELGLKMVVFRGTERIGYIRVTQLHSHDAMAHTTRRKADFRPGDKARVIFKLPEFVTDYEQGIRQVPYGDTLEYTEEE